jgi:hypothetical protein
VSTAFAERRIDLVFDLDWTSIYPIKDNEYSIDPSSVIKADRQYFRVADFLVPVLDFLHREGHYQISFYSGGSTERNETAVTEIYRRINSALKPGETPRRPFKILSRSDLNQVGDPQQLRFSEAYKKDITKLGPEASLDWTLLIDDQAEFATKGQERNLLYIGETYIDVADYDTWSNTNRSKEPNRKYDPPDRLRWAQERTKLLLVLDLIHRASSNASESGKSFVDEMDALRRSKLAGLDTTYELIAARLRSLALLRPELVNSSRERTTLNILKTWNSGCDALSATQK